MPSKKFLGVITIFRIMTFLVFRSFRPDQSADELSLEYLEKTTNTDLPITHLLSGHSQAQSRYVQLTEEQVADVHALVSAFVEHTVHRIFIKPQSDSISEAKLMPVTQSDVVRFLAHSDMVLWPELAKTPIAKLTGFGSNDVIKVKANRPAIEAYREMYLNNFEALAIVDSTESLINTLSVSDLRGMSRKTLDRLLWTSEELASKAHSIKSHVALPATATFMDVVNAVADAGVHTAWIVDSANRVSRIVNLSDIIHTFAKVATN